MNESHASAITTECEHGYYVRSNCRRCTASDALIAAAEAAGAVEFNRWVADGMLCRRYISPDGNIDLTVRVP